MFGLFKKKEAPSERFPPVPGWRPSFDQPLDRIADRIRYYTNGAHDFAVFRHGTVAILPSGLSEAEADERAKDALRKVFHAHPDMHPLNMDDGNILVRYNHDVVNVVLSEVVSAHWPEIQKEHQRALATSEVLITPNGPNKFDDFGMKALFGRCYMFMDAQDPQVVKVERHAA